ncbi:MAG: trehalase, partial [Bacteroidota bacterium]
MKIRYTLIFLVPLLFFLIGCNGEGLQKEQTSAQQFSTEMFPNVLDLRGTPDSVFDRSVFAFTDLGAWFAYALPEREKGAIGFSGPFLMTQDNGCWLSPILSQLELIVSHGGGILNFDNASFIEATSYPGKLGMKIHWEKPAIELNASLIFANKNTSLQHFVIKNKSTQEDLSIRAKWKGEVLLDNAFLEENSNGVQVLFANRATRGLITPIALSGCQFKVSEKRYTIISPVFNLRPGSTQDINLTHVFSFSSTSLVENVTELASIAQSISQLLEHNERQWNSKLDQVIYKIAPSFTEEAYQRVAVKCVQTLTTNWRSAAGFLKHDGLFPSYNYQWFNGFWSWDSWKHAVALAQFDTDLAKNQILAMYDFQDDYGMIADCVYRDTIIENHNWRDTKPPLSAWAIWHTFQASSDTTFLRHIFPKAEKYHQWWYQNRDHDQNGLCEYGSTDGSLIAAKWESGLDNAGRFDDTKMVQNSEQAWSMNRESVDL